MPLMTATIPDPKPTAPIAPPSTPMLQAPPQPDDIPDPPVPPEAFVEPPGATQPLEGSGTPPQGGSTPPAPLWKQQEALVQSCCNLIIERVNQTLRDVMKSVDTVYGNILQIAGARIETQAQANEHAQIQLSDALYQLQAHGLGSLGAPYTVTIGVESPSGYPLTFTVAAPDQAALLTGIFGLLKELQVSGCTAPQKAGA